MQFTKIIITRILHNWKSFNLIHIPQFIIIEPENADCVFQSIKNNKPTSVDIKKETISAGGTKRFHVRAVRDILPPKEYQSRYTFQLLIAAIFITSILYLNFSSLNTESKNFSSKSPIISTILLNEEITEEYIIDYLTDKIAENDIYIPK